MPLADLKVIRSTAKIGDRVIPVIRPHEPISRLFSSALGDGDWRIFADKDAVTQLSLWMSLASTTQDAIVWLTASGDRPDFEEPSFETCDLALVHHSLQLKASQWRQARKQASMGSRSSSLSVVVPDGDSGLIKDRHWRTRKPEPGAEVVDFALHSRTVFMVGSQATFRHLADMCVFQATATSLGDHTHLFNLARHEPEFGARADLLLAYCPPERWTLGKPKQ